MKIRVKSEVDNEEKGLDWKLCLYARSSSPNCILGMYVIDLQG